MRRLCLLFLGISLVIGGTPAAAAIVVNRPVEPGGGPTEIRFQAVLLDLREIDAKNQSFTANFFLAARWKDERLAHKEAGELALWLREVWNPWFQVLNQERISPTLPEIVRISPDGMVFFQQRYWGSFTQPMDFRDFPFDRHLFRIRIVAPGYRPDEVKWIADPHRPSELASSLSLPDWDVEGWRLEFTPYTPSVGSETVASFAFVFEAKRKGGFFVWKLIFIFMLIVAMSWIVFWIDPREFGTQIGVATTSMLTIIAYRFVVGGLVPNVSYLTRMDYFILGCNVLVFLALVQAVITGDMAKAEKVPAAKRIDCWCRIIFPALLAGVSLYSFVF